MGELLISVIPRQSDGGYLAPPTAVGPESFSSRSADIAQSVATVANAVHADLEQRLKSDQPATHRLEEIELKFTLDLEAEAGVIIARTKASAGFEVTLRWRRDT